MTDNAHPTLQRIARDIRDRKEADTGDDTGAGKPSTIDALRAISQADSDAHLARIAQRTTPTTERDAS